MTMITLLTDIGPSDSTIEVSAGVARSPEEPALRVTVDAEDMYVSSRDCGGLSWPVVRGANLTSRAAHDAGAVVVPQAEGSAGGAVSVSDGSTTVNPATSLVFSGATVSDGGGGEADVAVSGGASPYAGTTPGAPIPLAPVDYLLSSTVETIPAHTYYNGPADDGVGATVTEDVATDGVLTADGANPTVGQRIIWYAQVVVDPALEAGIYVVTATGDGVTVPWVLTRATDCETPAQRCRFWTANILSGAAFTKGSAHVIWSDLANGRTDLALAGTLAHADSASTAQGRGSSSDGIGAIATGYAAHAHGNSRAAGDYSHAEGDAIASGPNSHAESGGQATGQSSHAEGTSIASGEVAHAEGKAAIAYGFAQHALSGGLRGGVIAQQASQQTYSNQTPDNTPIALGDEVGHPFSFLQADAITSDYTKTAVVKGRIVARRTDTPGTDSAWDFAGVIRGDGSAYSWVGGADPMPEVIAQDADASTWAVAVTISGASIVVTVTGEVGKTIDWMCTLELDEVV